MTHKFRIYNGSGLTQACWSPCGLPFAKGELQDGKAVHVLGEDARGLYPVKTLERWNDGTVRRALIDFQAKVAAWTEKTWEYEATNDVSYGTFVPPDITGASVVFTIDGVTIPVTSWQTTYVSRTRAEFAGTARYQDLTIRVWATLWAGQPFGDVVVSIGNEDLTRNNWPRPQPVFVSDVRVRFEGAIAQPTYPHVHAVETMGDGSYRLLANTSIGDGQRWMTGFDILFVGNDQKVENWEIRAGYAWHAYRPIGLAEPEAEDETYGHGLHGRLREGVWPYLTMAEAPIDEFSREKWENFGSWWLDNVDPNGRWSGNGYWMLYGGTSGFHPGWGPTATGRDGKALSPKGYARWRALCMTRQRAPMWWGYPLAPGFAPAHPRQGNDWMFAGQTCNGWSSHPDAAHHEDGVLGTVHQRYGEEWMRGALLQSAALACSTAKGNETNFGEGRWAARVLERKVWGFLVGNQAERAGILANLIPWSESLNMNMRVLPGSSPPIHCFGVLQPGGQGYPLALLQSAGLPTDVPVMRFIFTEEQTLGSLSAAFLLTEIPSLALAGLKVAETWRKLVNADGTMAQVIIPDGRKAGSFVSTWCIPGLLKARATLPAFTELTAAANLHEAAWLHHWNWDGASFCQA